MLLADAARDVEQSAQGEDHLDERVVRRDPVGIIERVCLGGVAAGLRDVAFRLGAAIDGEGHASRSAGMSSLVVGVPALAVGGLPQSVGRQQRG